MTTPSRDYTELVIELWEACRSRKPKINLSQLGNGDSRNGIDEVGAAALLFLTCVERAEKKGHIFADWILAVEEFADKVSRYWAKGNIPFEVGELESIAYKVIKKYEEK